MTTRALLRNAVPTLVGVVLIGATLLAPASPAAGGPEPFRNGMAVATSQVVRVGPGVGNLTLASTAGVALTNVTNKIASAQAQTIDLGLVGGSITAPGCDGKPPTVKPEDVPQAHQADNRAGTASETHDDGPIAGSPLGGGRTTVSANATPAATADSTLLAANIASLVQIGGGDAQAASTIVNHEARQATSFATASLDLAGTVHLDGLRWNATHRTGAGATTVGAFSIGSGTIGGLPVPVDAPGALEKAVNVALRPFGLSVTLPKVQHITKPNDLIIVSPLVIALRDSPAGKAALGPALNASREQREKFYSALIAANCKLSSAALIADVASDILSGTGFMTVEVGGVTASSQDVPDFNPFGSNDPLLGAPIAPSFGGGDIGLPDIIGLTTPGLTLPGSQELRAVRSVCESTSPSTRIDCSRGRPVAVGLIGIALTALLGGFEWWRRRAAYSTTIAAS